MNNLPAEILLEIGKTNISTYRGMLAIPKFALAVTVGYRLDMMVGKYDYKKLFQTIYISAYNMSTNVEIETRRIQKHEFIRGISNNHNGYIIIMDHSVNKHYDSYRGLSCNRLRLHYNMGSIHVPELPLFISGIGNILVS